VLGNEFPEASVLGEIIPKASFYSFDAKYLDDDGASMAIPADVPEDIAEKVKNYALMAFRALECEGLSRVDFFVTAEGRIVLNEINTLPGFTSISMYPKLWEASGLPYSKLIDRLIQLGLERHARNRKLIKSV
jgi:D-alanine-D-alanine ligase